MKSTLRLNAKVFPIIAAIALVMQILDPSRVWMILLIGLGGIWPAGPVHPGARQAKSNSIMF
jgi:hypothetical protein